MRTNLDVWEEDQDIRADTMDESYDIGKPKSTCDQCDEFCWFDVHKLPYEGICDACIDENFRTEITDLKRTVHESIDSWVNRHNSVSEKWYKDSNYYRWCSECQLPTTWDEQHVPVREAEEDEMSWDVEHKVRDVCNRCNFVGYSGGE